MTGTMGCEAIEAMFVYGPSRCMKRGSGFMTCDDCLDREEQHTHVVCPEHGGPSDDR